MRKPPRSEGERRTIPDSDYRFWVYWWTPFILGVLFIIWLTTGQWTPLLMGAIGAYILRGVLTE
jgi:hypothetical protein